MSADSAPVLQEPPASGEPPDGALARQEAESSSSPERDDDDSRLELWRIGRLLLAVVLATVLAEILAAVGIGTAPHDQHRQMVQVVFFSAGVASAALIYLATRPRRIVALSVLLGGLALGGVLTLLTDWPLRSLFYGLGIASILALAWNAIRTQGRERREALVLLLASLLLPSFTLMSGFYLGLTALVRPATYDGLTVAVDASLGFQASFVVGQLFQSQAWLSWLCTQVYMLLPLSFGGVYALQRSRRVHPRDNVLGAFLAIACCGYLLYFLFPVVGPIYVFERAYPGAPPTDVSMFLRPVVGFTMSPAPRNCMPSLHTAWALIAFLQARSLGPRLFAAFGVFFSLTALATLGLGWHYLVDLVVAIPFTVAVHAATTHCPPAARRSRNLTLSVCAALTLAWLLAIRFVPGVFLAGGPVLPWVLTLATVGASVYLERDFHRVRRSIPAQALAVFEPTVRAIGRRHVALAGIFFLSGFAGLCYEVIFAKALGLTFGSTARSSSVVLAVFMGGNAVGSWLGGRLASRIERPVRGYALTEAAIALWCAATPALVDLLKGAYVGAAYGTDPSSLELMPAQVLIAAALLFPPTVLMGISTPMLARYLTDDRQSLGHATGLLYAMNTLGAALGALLTGYLILPALGVYLSTMLAVVLNVLAASVGFWLARRLDGAHPAASSGSIEPAASTGGGRLLSFVALVILGIGGFVTFALETTYIHLLGVVAGNSAYAFALMVFSFLIGLSSGAALGRRILQRTREPLLAVGMLEAVLASVLCLGVYLWDEIPDYFAVFNGYPLTTSFAIREFVRFLVCCVAMVPPAVLIGAIYPLAMECVGMTQPKRRIVAMGRAAALNTVGNIAGAIVGGIVLVDELGSMASIHLVAALCLGLALLPLAITSSWKQRIPLLCAIAVGGALLVVRPASFDLDRLTSGANVYFAKHSYGTTVDHSESMEGGLTSIAESRDADGSRVLTMLTNGKFQGDDSKRREMTAQFGISVVPLLHAPARERALVIGLGTGVSARVVWDAGFWDVHVAELSRDVVHMARKHFGSVNRDVLSGSNVHTHLTDGRNFLLLTDKKFDLIGIEISSIWFAGAANLYNREFYQTAAAALSDRGVLQQWVQLHRLSRKDIATIVTTARMVFDKVWIYLSGTQGVMVACNWDCQPNRSNADQLNLRPEMQDILAMFDGRAENVLKHQLLQPEMVDRMISDVAAVNQTTPAKLVSTDDNLMLEYSTPKANVREYGPSFAHNLEMLRNYQR